ncbi:hypothetical protein ACHAXT_012353 [Thalassiosira profunda]
MRGMLALHAYLQLLAAIRLAGGFLLPVSPITARCSHASGCVLALSTEKDDNDASATTGSPSVPECDIDECDLLSQAYQILTVKQLRDILREKGAKVSGNKRELIDRLGEILASNDDEMPSNVTSMQTDDEQHQMLDSYTDKTLKQLKERLRQLGASVSGNKMELVQRLMTLQHENHEQPPLDSETMAEPATESWSILEPRMPSNTESDATTNGAFTELPFLSGLIFVNKPSGWSTLPTKQQLDDPSNAAYPCLSDSVNKWLRNDSEGNQRIKQAIKDEAKLWKFILQSTSDSKRRKKWKKRKEKLDAKLPTFAPRPVHRLDIDTSGIVCIALTPYALRAANMLFERKSRGSFDETQSSPLDNNGEMEGVQKKYVAVVEGELGGDDAPTTGVIEHSIGQVWIEDHNEWACDVSDDGTSALIRPGELQEFVPGSLREARTGWTSLGADKSKRNLTRVELTPHTGRGHQLRLHLLSMGHPIVGDDMHGPIGGKESATTAINGGKLCLHASKLSMDVWSSREDAPDDGFQICRVDVESSPPF